LEVEKSNGYPGLTLCKIGPDKQLYFLKGVGEAFKCFPACRKTLEIAGFSSIIGVL